MAISIAQHNVTSHATAAVSAGITTAVGSTLVAVLTYDNGGFTSFVDSKGNTWTQIGTEQVIGGNHAARAYINEGGTRGASHTFTLTAGHCTEYIQEITGALASSALDQFAKNTDTGGTPWDTGSITTTQAAELIIALITGTGSGTNIRYTPGNSFTELDFQNNGNNFWSGTLMTRTVASTGTYNATTTAASGTPGNTIGLIFSLKEAAGGGGGSIAAISNYYRMLRGSH